MNTQRHRHIVALPIVLLAMAGVTVLHAVLPVVSAREPGRTLSAALAGAADEPFVLQGASGILRSGSQLRGEPSSNTLVLTRGQVLLRADGLLALELGETKVYAVGATLVAVRDADTETVAVLEGSVVIERPSGISVVFPGTQVLFRDSEEASVVRTPLADEWKASMLEEVLSVTPRSHGLGAARDQDADLLKRCTAAGTDASLMNADDLREAAMAAFRQPRVTLAAYRCVRFAARRLGPSGALSMAAFLKIAGLGNRVDADAVDQLLSDIHDDPLLSERFMTLLPELVENLAVPVPSGLLDAWSENLIKLGLVHPPDAIASLRSCATLPASLARAGFPIQSQSWTAAMRRVVMVLETTAPVEHRATFHDVLSLLQQNVLPPAKDASSSSSSAASKAVPPEPATHWSAEELSAIAQEALATHGALIATTTIFTPDVATQSVRIDGVYVDEGGVHVPYAFIYAPEHDLFTMLIRDGRRLPNAVPLSTFFAR